MKMALKYLLWLVTDHVRIQVLLRFYPSHDNRASENQFKEATDQLDAMENAIFPLSKNRETICMVWNSLAGENRSS